jgi:hypothetical protein
LVLVSFGAVEVGCAQTVATAGSEAAVLINDSLWRLCKIAKRGSLGINLGRFHRVPL